MANHDDDEIFDEDRYNFLINRRNCFTCDGTLSMDQLIHVLNNFDRSDICLFEQLHYYFEERVFIQVNPNDQKAKSKEKEFVLKKMTPLHLALQQGNTRSINILLKYMSKVEKFESSTI